MKFTLRSEFGDYGTEENISSELVFHADHLDDILSNFEQFLMGSGFTWLKSDSIRYAPEEEEPEGTCSGGCCGNCHK